MKTHYIERGRDWLNTEDSWDSGSISWYVSLESYGDYIPTSPDASLTIRDCSRSISLEFGFVKDTYQERLDKIDLVINHLQKMRSSMVECAKICEEEWNKEGEKDE